MISLYLHAALKNNTHIYIYIYIYIYVEAVICYSIYSLTPVVPLICRTLEDGSIGGGGGYAKEG